MYQNRFAVLTDECEKSKKKHKKQSVSGSSSKNQAISEGSNNESGISPILQSIPSEDFTVAEPTSAPLLFMTKSRPPLKLVQKEKAVIANLSNPDDLATQRTDKRISLLINKLTKLKQFMSTEPELSLINMLTLEKHLIGITEVLIRLRENFKAKHYGKLVQEYEINGVNISWPKIIRNRIVHEFVTKSISECYHYYVQLAKALSKLDHYQPINLDSFIDKQKDYAQKEKHKLEYTESIESILNSLFNNIVEYEDESMLVQLMSMTRAAEIIRQLMAQDPESLNSGKIKIMGQTLDPEIVPYMMAIRTMIYHNIPGFPDDHAEAIMDYAQSLFENKKSNKKTI